MTEPQADYMAYRMTRTTLLARDGQWCHYCGCRLLLPDEVVPLIAALPPYTMRLDQVHPRRLRPPDPRRSIYRRRLAIDHKVPRSADGTDDLDNLVLACQYCNTVKGGMPYETFLRDTRLIARIREIHKTKEGVN